MQLLAHRGIWNQPEEKNSINAIARSFELGIGIETDIRDCDGTLVVSHDPPRSADALPLDVVLQAYRARPTRPMLALNIKADGLQAALLAALRRHTVEHYFVFDMSVPDTLGYQRLNMPFAARISEYELSNTLAITAQWIWLDAFHGEWYDAALARNWLDKGKRVAVVSPELHRRQHLPLWKTLKALQDHPSLYLCTDLVTEAKDFFDACSH